MKACIAWILVYALAFPANVWADCTQKAQDADKKCDKNDPNVKAAKEVYDYCNAQMAGSNVPKEPTVDDKLKISDVKLTEILKQCKDGKMPEARAKLNEFIKNCSDAIEQCSQQCAAEQSDPVRGPTATTNKNKCENGTPAQTRDQAKMDLGQLLAVLAGLAALIMALMGQDDEKPPEEGEVDCTKTPYDPKCRPDIAADDDPATFTTGEVRTRGGEGDFLDSNLSGQLPVATGTPAQASYSGLPSGSGGGSGAAGMGAAGAGGFGRGADKKAEGDGSPKINLASTPGGGGGGAGMGGGRGGAHPGSGAVATRSGIDGNEKLAAAVEKAVQQRGVASEGPMGGITAAHSLDNFQKVEKRIQSERNQLNEF